MRYLRGFLVVLLFWYALALLVSGPIIPYPHVVFAHLLKAILSANIYLHLLFSLYRILTGTMLALLVAIPAGLAIGRVKRLDRVLSPTLYLLYPLPKIAFLPVFMVLFGIGDLSKIILIAVIIFFPATLTIRDGVKEMPFQYLELAQAYHLTSRQVLTDIIWPSILPRIFSSLRITVGISLSVLFVSETYAATYGLGYTIMNNWVMANYVGMYAGIVLLSLLGLLLYIVIDKVEQLVIPAQAR
ncbi:MAG: ABC transporter permease [Spirochaetales bacterium]|jgi:ABC-type nitrate/sulfonate/bicarbonate transport system permease component|nr:ABC transporter permease [Spirochaetales bacterium]